MVISAFASSFVLEFGLANFYASIPFIGEAHIYLDRRDGRRWWGVRHEGGGIEFRFGWLHVVANR